MNKKSFWLSILAVIISFIGGFFLANAYNRSELESLQSEIGRLKNSTQSPDRNGAEQTLADEEILQKIKEADDNPENVEFQKGLATALYQYSNMKQEPKWLVDVARLFERAHAKNERDYSTLISLGNIYFDIAQNRIKNGDGNENSANTNFFENSRKFYLKALNIKPNDTDVRTDLGLTHLLAYPPDNARAIVEFQKVLQANPKDEKALASMARAHINNGKTSDAAQFAARLKDVNPSSQMLPDLETQLAQIKNNKQ